MTTEEMVDRIKAAVDAKSDADFIVMARTDALAVDGFDAVLERVLPPALNDNRIAHVEVAVCQSGHVSLALQSILNLVGELRVLDGLSQRELISSSVATEG